ncbi:HAMP domain-containing histidine kinase [Jannaschia sp. Os4]|uniref:sensor histidine kinase n=1 Tax=Jannaschia sp. Os4 TaxID=2807617 RepID=UPI00193AC59B|nr:HAMP domain-containing sensor histidine kinase [Jannaschia sp. Os4]MBM2577342.1 HAMP domain-containing histidine kinase [Jannaschia sp. Os4]
MLTSLSGRFLILTVVFVLLAEMLIFVPSIARFRADWLSERMERAQIASLTLLSAPEMIDMGLEEELLANAGVLNVVLRRDELRQLILSSDLPGPVARTVDLRDPPATTLIADALRRYASPTPEIVRVIAEPAMGGGLQIEAAIDTKPLRAAMIEYGINILALSAVISAITAAFLFLAVRRLMVMPIRGLVRHMNAFAAAPEDARRVIEPRSRITELREAETTLRDLETQLQQNLRQKERLAQLGGAVAKIAHDLRNILTTATLLGDRLESIDDPTVRRVGPKIVKSLARAVSLTEGTLAFGRAEEAPPRLQQVPLRDLLEEVAEAERLAVPDGAVAIEVDADPATVIRADPDQMLRVLGNLVRNARQAIQATGQGGRVVLRGADRPDAWRLEVSDDGPGLPPQAREGLFEAFKGSVRKGGTGLGLAIAAELVRGHGGTLDLAGSDEGGTTFRVDLPKGEVG